MTLQNEKQLEDRINGILLEYAQVTPKSLPLDRALSLRNDLAIESLSLVSVVLRLGDDIGVDVVDAGLDLSTLATVGDLLKLGQNLQVARGH